MTKFFHLMAALCLCILGTEAGATDRYVDWNLSAGDGVNTFASLTDAVAASVNGDRIIIVPGQYYEQPLTINKSLTLIPSDGSGIINFNAIINVTGQADGKLELVSIHTGAYALNVTGTGDRFNLTALSCQFGNVVISGGGNMSASNRSEFHCIDGTISSDFTANVNGWDPRLIRTTVGGTATIRCGDVVMCSMPRLVVNDESGGNSAAFKMSIIQNVFTDYVEFRNDNHLVRFANNQIKNMYWFMWNHTSGSNDIVNNEFVNNSYIHFPWNPPGWAHRFYNNTFGTTYFMRWATEYAYWDNTNFNWCDTDNNCNCGGGQVDIGDQRWNGQLPYIGTRNMYHCDNGNCCYGASIGSNINFWATNEAAFPNPAYGGFFEWNYNSIGLPQPAISGSNPIVYGEVGNGGTNVDGGSPAHEFYDLDLTVNDRGRAGGPWGYANFPADTDAKALIYDLDMPADLFPGQDVEIRAKAYQRN